MKTVPWNHPFQFSVAVYEGEDVDIEKARELLTQRGFKFNEFVQRLRHRFIVEVTLHNVQKAVSIFKIEAVKA